jgi:hypothetical protein
VPRSASVLLVVAFVPASVAGGLPGELSLIVDGQEVDAEGATSEVHAMGLRWIHGNRTEWRIELPWLDVDAPEGVVLTGAGPLPGSRLRRGNPEATPGPGDRGGKPEAVGTPIPEPSGSVSGLGDLRVGLSRVLSGGGARRLRVDGEVDVKAPTARDQLGTGEWDARIGAAGEYRFWSLTAFGGVGWTRLGDPDGFALQDPPDLYAGVESAPLLGERLRVAGWARVQGEILPGSGPRRLYGVGLRTAGRIRWRLRLVRFEDDLLQGLTVTVGLSAGGSFRRLAAGRSG